MPAKTPTEIIARRLNLSEGGVTKTIELLDAGNTVPFITRYRQDQTGGLDEEQITAVRDLIARHRQLEERKATILRSLQTQEKLTDALRQQILTADSLRRLDDLYLPFKPKKQSLASKAREQGLEPLATEILAESPAAENLEARATEFINAEKEVPDGATALVGAGHIIAEQVGEDAELRQRARSIVRKSGKLCAKRIDGVTDKKAETFKSYLDYREAISKVPPHRVLAINRGEKAEVLRVSIDCDTEAIERLAVELKAPAEHAHHEFLAGAAKDAVNRLIVPSLQREARRELNDTAESHSLSVFARNLRNLLMQPPLPGHRVLAIDPGYKNGCKLAAIDEFGSILAVDLVHITGEKETAEARQKLVEFINTHNLDLVAIGNGKACRPTEELVASLIADDLKDRQLHYVVVNEAGASVYSTSTVGREEMPDLEAVQRSAVSIGRRLQDPLSELVKIDPASVGVGLYQHDAKNKPMRDALDDVVQSCVSFVGVELNTASASLLRYVAGLNQLTARRVYEHRQEKGPFKSRQQLMEVSGVGDAAFVQSAGFLRIESAENPLDATWVHPESYEVATRLLSALGVDSAAIGTAEGIERFKAALVDRDLDALAGELEIGRLTLDQLVDALSRPGRDPREELPPPVFRNDVVKFEDLAPGIELKGTVLNVVDFGAFVDVGLSDSGLVHISQMSADYVRDPHAVTSVGDQVRVWVETIDADRRRVALTMIEPGTEKPAPAKRPPRRKPRQKAVASTEGAGAEAGTEGGATTDRSRKSRPPRNREGRRQQGNRQKGKRPDKRGGRQQQSGGNRSRGFETRSKAPAKPITAEMKEGKEAMRTFGDLLQFVKEKDEKPADETKQD